jgi:hypothetical protein
MLRGASKLLATKPFWKQKHEESAKQPSDRIPTQRGRRLLSTGVRAKNVGMFSVLSVYCGNAIEH